MRACARNYRALLITLAVAWGWLLAPLPAGAQPLLPLSPTTPVTHTAGHLQQLEDPAGTLDAAQADQAAGWADLPGDVSASYTSATIWLRLRVSTAQPGNWMLLRNALLDDVRVYVQPEGGAWRPPRSPLAETPGQEFQDAQSNQPLPAT